MDSLYIEQRTYNRAAMLSQDIAHHLFTRRDVGPVVVVTERPPSFMGAVKKQWGLVIRQAQNERSRTLDQERIAVLSHEIDRMAALPFATLLKAGSTRGGVIFATPEQLLREAPACATLYVACPVPQESLEPLTARMPEHSLLVLYRRVGRTGHDDQPEYTFDD